MAASNKTHYYNLPQWVGTDKPSFTADLNQAFATIDTEVHGVGGDAANALAAANAAMDVATAALSKRRADTLYANALIGNAQGDMVHVEDAWEADAVGLGVLGKSVQDGTPTPDVPVEVDVVDGPVTVQVVGKNLLAVRLPPRIIAGITYSKNGDGSITLSGTATSHAYFRIDQADGSVSNLANYSGTYTLSGGGTGPIMRLMRASDFANIIEVRSTTPTTKTFAEVNCFFDVWVPKGITVNATYYPQLELGSIATPYEPYISNQQTITLPSDHNYLASLPDGTRDELVLRADGVAVLVERISQIASYNGEPITTSYMSTTGQLTTGATIYYATDETTVYSADNGATWSTTDPAAGNSAIQLYKGTNNVWCTDALSPTVDLDYVQDTNKVINKLRAAIVASGATS